MMKSIRRPYPT